MNEYMIIYDEIPGFPYEINRDRAPLVILTRENGKVTVGGADEAGSDSYEKTVNSPEWKRTYSEKPEPLAHFASGSLFLSFRAETGPLDAAGKKKVEQMRKMVESAKK